MTARSLAIFVCALGLAGTVAAQAPEEEAPQVPSGYDTGAQPAPATAAVPAPEAQAPEAGMAGDHSKRAQNTIYLEGLGAGLFYSINYERLVIPDLAVRLGFGYIGLGASATSGGTTSSASVSMLQFPITASYLGLGSDTSIFELGGGLNLSFVTGSASSGVVSASGSGVAPLALLFAGYRLHPTGGPGFNFRVGAMALIAPGLSLSDPDPDTIGVLPWLYMSLGGSF